MKITKYHHIAVPPPSSLTEYVFIDTIQKNTTKVTIVKWTSIYLFTAYEETNGSWMAVCALFPVRYSKWHPLYSKWRYPSRESSHMSLWWILFSESITLFYSTHAVCLWPHNEYECCHSHLWYVGRFITCFGETKFLV